MKRIASAVLAIVLCIFITVRSRLMLLGSDIKAMNLIRSRRPTPRNFGPKQLVNSKTGMESTHD